MHSVLYLFGLFVAKMLDNILGTARTILVQKNCAVLAGVFLTLSNIIHLYITKNIVNGDSAVALIVVAIASGVGCTLAVSVNNRFSVDRTYVNIIMSDDIDAMRDFRDFLAKNKITNTVSDCYTLDWSRKSLTITAYAETKYQSRLIDTYLKESTAKFKRIVNGNISKQGGR